MVFYDIFWISQFRYIRILHLKIFRVLTTFKMCTLEHEVYCINKMLQGRLCWIIMLILTRALWSVYDEY